MDSDERVMALKKAYADIILNTAKDAAARVMMSERKAQRFEHELKVAKEEGLRMLLRIKQMLDAKVSEAKLTALSQKKKIDELEAQLHEAEDIVRDVREELREVQSELDIAKSDKAQCIKQNYIPIHEELELNRLYTSQLAEFRTPELYSGFLYSHTTGHASNDQRDASHDCFRTSIYSRYSDGGSPDLPSIISRRKVPFFYRNGCNQRIRACEMQRLDHEFTLSACINKTKDEISVKEVEGGKVTCNLQRQHNENKETSKKKVIMNNLNPDSSRISKRKRTSASHLKKENLSSRNIFGESTKSDKELPCLTPNSLNDDAHIDGGRSETCPRFLSRKGELSMHLECSGNAESGGELINRSTDQIKENRHAGLTREMAQKNMDRRESSDIMDTEKGIPSSVELEPNASKSGNGLPKQTINDGPFKYTFQTKRKRDSLVNENDSPENNLPEKYVPVNRFYGSCDAENFTSQENGSSKANTSDTLIDPERNTLSRDVVELANLPKSSSVIESPQDSLGLLQVAHQLMSMSEKVVSTVSPAFAE
ncbi:hypothetical protein LIER_03519 [Lithospermum erythrorhizon]|uniref:Uncharacterized protein n=1 Tax=Lithospermum erythrorhizon TaxID=34254 RepID=A0AAV3NTG5_LITER